jgi:hypothetical protein
MPDGEDQDVVAVQLVIQNVGKAAKAAAPRFSVDARPELRSPLERELLMVTSLPLNPLVRQIIAFLVAIADWRAANWI